MNGQMIHGLVVITAGSDFFFFSPLGAWEGGEGGCYGKGSGLWEEANEAWASFGKGVFCGTSFMANDLHETSLRGAA